MIPALVPAPFDMNAIVPARDILFVVLDTLRYDVARDLARAGRTPNLTALLPGNAWEERHAPGTFTYASHQAMFAGYLPTPARPGVHPRLFALRFEGSESTAATTCVLDDPLLNSYRGIGAPPAGDGSAAGAAHRRPCKAPRAECAAEQPSARAAERRRGGVLFVRVRTRARARGDVN